MKRSVIALFASALLTAPLLAQEEGPASAQGASVNTTGKGYTAAYVLETSTGQVLFDENSHVQLPTASMAKMMTCLITMEEIRDGRLKLDSPVTISARASKMGGSQIYAKDGQVFPVQTLLAATMIQSANDAAEALAEKIAGSPEAFADMMNDRAKQLGLKESMFYDPHGLPNAANPKQINTMSAHDLAVVGMALMKYPLMRQFASTPTFPFSNGTFTAGLTNPNHLIQPGKRDYYDAATGIKTGYSGPAGFCVTASAKKGDMELVCVVMGAKTSSGPVSSFAIASRLMSAAFNSYRLTSVVKKGAVVGQVPVSGGQAATVHAIATADARALLKRGEEGSAKMSFSPMNVTAPVKQGQQVGTVVVTQGGKQISKTPAIAGEAVLEQPWWKKFWPF